MEKSERYVQEKHEGENNIHPFNLEKISKLNTDLVSLREIIDISETEILKEMISQMMEQYVKKESPDETPYPLNRILVCHLRLIKHNLDNSEAVSAQTKELIIALIQNVNKVPKMSRDGGLVSFSEYQQSALVDALLFNEQVVCGKDKEEEDVLEYSNDIGKICELIKNKENREQLRSYLNDTHHPHANIKILSRLGVMVYARQETDESIRQYLNEALPDYVAPQEYKETAEKLPIFMRQSYCELKKALLYLYSLCREQPTEHKELFYEQLKLAKDSLQKLIEFFEEANHSQLKRFLDLKNDKPLADVEKNVFFQKLFVRCNESIGLISMLHADLQTKLPSTKRESIPKIFEEYGLKIEMFTKLHNTVVQWLRQTMGIHLNEVPLFSTSYNENEHILSTYATNRLPERLYGILNFSTDSIKKFHEMDDSLKPITGQEFPGMFCTRPKRISPEFIANFIHSKVSDKNPKFVLPRVYLTGVSM